MAEVVDQVTRSTLLELADEREGPCVSIYMPVESAGQQVRQNPIRLGNLAADATERLIARGMRPENARRMLAPVADIYEDADPSGQPGEGLAVFVAPGMCRTLRVPMRPDEQVILGSRFITRPLLPLVEGEGYFYLLGISEGETKLWRGTRARIEEVPVEDMPGSIEEISRFEDPEKSLQHYSLSSGQAMYHGHGAAKDAGEHLMEQYVRAVESAVTSMLGQEQAPLVLATTEDTEALYRRLNSYRRLVDQWVPGNVEGRNPNELLEEGWALIQDHMNRVRRQAVARYVEEPDRDRIVSVPEDVVRLAGEGRVEELFLEAGASMPGRFDYDSYTFEPASEIGQQSDDMLDLAAVFTLRAGGRVRVLPGEEMPPGTNGRKMAAIIRG